MLFDVLALLVACLSLGLQVAEQIQKANQAERLKQLLDFFNNALVILEEIEEESTKFLDEVETYVTKGVTQIDEKQFDPLIWKIWNLQSSLDEFGRLLKKNDEVSNKFKYIIQKITKTRSGKDRALTEWADIIFTWQRTKLDNEKLDYIAVQTTIGRMLTQQLKELHGMLLNFCSEHSNIASTI